MGFVLGSVSCLQGGVSKLWKQGSSEAIVPIDLADVGIRITSPAFYGVLEGKDLVTSIWSHSVSLLIQVMNLLRLCIMHAVIHHWYHGAQVLRIELVTTASAHPTLCSLKDFKGVRKGMFVQSDSENDTEESI